MTACLLVGGVALTLASAEFQLRWTHSVEKVEWVEDWRIETTALHLTGARVRGSGAGMEPGDGAILQDGWWKWSANRHVEELALAASGATGGGWTLCDGKICRSLGESAGQPVTLAPCRR